MDDTLEALEITELFDSVRTACEVASGKPAPDVYLLVAKEMGVARSAAWSSRMFPWVSWREKMPV